MLLTFTEYLESKNILKNAAEDAAKIKMNYYITKYCKIPVRENEDSDKKYIALKPKDVIQILWEKHDDKMFARQIVINDADVYHTTWTIKKFNNWVQTTCNNI